MQKPNPPYCRKPKVKFALIKCITSSAQMSLCKQVMFLQQPSCQRPLLTILEMSLRSLSSLEYVGVCIHHPLRTSLATVPKHCHAIVQLVHFCVTQVKKSLNYFCRDQGINIIIVLLPVKTMQGWWGCIKVVIIRKIILSKTGVDF